jgi:hypothetical protein
LRLLAFVALTIVVLPVASAGNVLPMVTDVSVETVGDTIRITYDIDDPD